MQIEKKYRIESCVSTKEIQENMRNVFITKKHAIATDGHVLVKVPIDFEKGDTEGWVSTDALKLSRKVGARSQSTVQIGLNGSQVLPDGTTMTRPTESNPPNTEAVIQDAQKDRKFTVGLDVSLLQSLSDALGTSDLVLSFRTPESAILVRPLDADDKSVGILMPKRITK